MPFKHPSIISTSITITIPFTEGIFIHLPSCTCICRYTIFRCKFICFPMYHKSNSYLIPCEPLSFSCYSFMYVFVTTNIMTIVPSWRCFTYIPKLFPATIKGQGSIYWHTPKAKHQKYLERMYILVSLCLYLCYIWVHRYRIYVCLHNI